MGKEKEVVYLSFNDWEFGTDYPPICDIIRWVEDGTFENELFVKEQKLCVNVNPYDMSMNYCITAPMEWVKQFCPEVLTNYTYIYHKSWDGNITGKRYCEFACTPGKNGKVVDRFGFSFLPYTEENIGVHYPKEEAKLK